MNGAVLLAHSRFVIFVGEFASVNRAVILVEKDNRRMLYAVEHVGFNCGVVVHVLKGETVADFRGNANHP
jgi:hypothetical protein